MDDIMLFGRKPEPIQIKIENSKELIQRGLNYFFGDSAEWLPEYDEISDWLHDNKGKGLLCIGDSGRGKTFITNKIISPILE